MPEIEYESESFPGGLSVSNGRNQLSISWDDILWAALTVGRPNRAAVFQHGNSSLYEAIFRMSLVRMAIEQVSQTARRLRRTGAVKTLDPSEKGAVNYFIGMMVCKLFADRVLGVPWMLHLDVFRSQLAVVLTGRSRPDLLGQRPTGEWIVLESKGRASAPDSAAKAKAKEQAERCVSVGGADVTLHIGAVAYFRGDILQFFWRDPAPDREKGGNPINIDVTQGIWRYHYHLALALKQAGAAGVENEIDVTVNVHPDVLKLLRGALWDGAKAWCEQNAGKLKDEGFRSDGLQVMAGKSWQQPFDGGTD